jgi:hypothetical protein
MSQGKKGSLAIQVREMKRGAGEACREPSKAERKAEGSCPGPEGLAKVQRGEIVGDLKGTCGLERAKKNHRHLLVIQALPPLST